MIVCVALPRFELVVAAGGRRDLLSGPVALAPELGRAQLIGAVSPAAEAQGVEPGLRLGEALARCPRLVLLPPDPVTTRVLLNLRVGLRLHPPRLDHLVGETEALDVDAEFL